MRTKANKVHFDLISVHTKPNAYDCGLAYATELLNGCDPTLCNLDNGDMRQHLLCCLAKGHLFLCTKLEGKDVDSRTYMQNSWWWNMTYDWMQQSLQMVPQWLWEPRYQSQQRGKICSLRTNGLDLPVTDTESSLSFSMLSLFHCHVSMKWFVCTPVQVHSHASECTVMIELYTLQIHGAMRGMWIRIFCRSVILNWMTTFPVLSWTQPLHSILLSRQYQMVFSISISSIEIFRFMVHLSEGRVWLQVLLPTAVKERYPLRWALDMHCTLAAVN